MNPSFKRFRLVEEDEFQRDRMKQLRDYNPELMSRVRKELSITDILDDESINAEQKLRMLRVMQHTLKPVEKSVKVPTNQKQVRVVIDQPGFRTEIPVAQLPVQPEEEQPEPELIQERDIDDVDDDEQVQLEGGESTFEDVVESLPQASRAKASQLANILSDKPNIISLTPKSELVIGGERIPQSNALSMFKYMFNPRHSSVTPVGYAKFVRSLAQLKVPVTLISNKNVQNYLKDALQSGHGKHPNPRKPIGYAKLPAKIRSKLQTPLSSLKLYKI